EDVPSLGKTLEAREARRVARAADQLAVDLRDHVRSDPGPSVGPEGPHGNAPRERLPPPVKPDGDLPGILRLRGLRDLRRVHHLLRPPRFLRPLALLAQLDSLLQDGQDVRPFHREVVGPGRKTTEAVDSRLPRFSPDRGTVSPVAIGFL